MIANQNNCVPTTWCAIGRIGLLLCSVMLSIGVDASEPEVAIGGKSRPSDRSPAVAPVSEGMTPLHQAVFSGGLDSVRSLIADGADTNVETLYGVTPLSIACTTGDARIVDELLKAGANPKQIMPGKTTLLMVAARAGSADIIRLLCERDVDVDDADRSGQTALMWAAAAGNVDAIEVLANAGAEMDLTSSFDFTALGFAARQGQLRVAQCLVEHGADVNREMQPSRTSGRNPRKGMSPLMLAIESGHFELAYWLLEQGADPNDQRSGYTPLHAITWVRKTGRGDNAAGDPPPRGSGRMHSLDFVRALVQAGADVNTQLRRGPGGRAKLNHRGATPFLLAAKTADLPLLELLLELGADPTLTNIDGCNAVMAASGIGVVAVGEEPGTESEVIEVIDWLVELGVELNAVDSNGETAMHGAAYRNFPAVVQKLAALGADPAIWNHENKHNWTPVMIASGKRPGSFKPSPVTIAALEDAMRKSPSESE